MPSLYDTSAMLTGSTALGASPGPTPASAASSPYNMGNADKTLAALNRSDFETFLSTEYPLLLQQSGQVGDADYLKQQQDTARLSASTNAAKAAGIRDRQLMVLGLTLSPEEQAVATKGDRISSRLADVSAYNRTTDAVRDRDMMIMSGTRSPLSSLTRSAS